MFPEYENLIESLKGQDMFFDRLFQKHNELNDKISSMTSVIGYNELDIERLKKEKLHLKDQIYHYLHDKEENQG